MESGAGQQNKVMEAMCAGKAVVSTSIGNSGIGARSGVNIVLAETDVEICNEISNLYRDT